VTAGAADQLPIAVGPQSTTLRTFRLWIISKLMRLIAYLVTSYIVSYLAHIPVHHGLANPLIPALVPWAMAALVAIWSTYKGQSLRPAWITLAIATTFFLLGHIVPHR
jgi:hypothetical protein